MAEAAGRREGKGRKENPSVAKKAERPMEEGKGTEEGAYERSRERSMMREEDDMPRQGIG